MAEGKAENLMEGLSNIFIDSANMLIESQVNSINAGLSLVESGLDTVTGLLGMAFDWF